MITAIILAAGQSKRMQQPKLLLPWGKTTVIGRIIEVLMLAGLDDLLVVTGGNRDELEKCLRDYPVSYIHNPDYANGEMITSLQTGLRNVTDQTTAILVVLGDQPQIEPSVVRALIEKYQAIQGEIIVPSYQNHRGHPWLIDRKLWDEIIKLQPPATLRDFLHIHQEKIQYLTVNTASVLQDLDTPQDYRRYQE